MKHNGFSMIPKAYDEVFNGNSRHPQDPKRSHVEITNENNVHHFVRYQGNCLLLIHSTNPDSQPS